MDGRLQLDDGDADNGGGDGDGDGGCLAIGFSILSSRNSSAGSLLTRLFIPSNLLLQQSNEDAADDTKDTIPKISYHIIPCIACCALDSSRQQERQLDEVLGSAWLGRGRLPADCG